MRLLVSWLAKMLASQCRCSLFETDAQGKCNTKQQAVKLCFLTEIRGHLYSYQVMVILLNSIFVVTLVMLWLHDKMRVFFFVSFKVDLLRLLSSSTRCGVCHSTCRYSALHPDCAQTEFPLTFRPLPRILFLQMYSYFPPKTNDTRKIGLFESTKCFGVVCLCRKYLD